MLQLQGVLFIFQAQLSISFISLLKWLNIKRTKKAGLISDIRGKARLSLRVFLSFCRFSFLDNNWYEKATTPERKNCHSIDMVDCCLSRAHGREKSETVWVKNNNCRYENEPQSKRSRRGHPVMYRDPGIFIQSLCDPKSLNRNRSLTNLSYGHETRKSTTVRSWSARMQTFHYCAGCCGNPYWFIMDRLVQVGMVSLDISDRNHGRCW